MTKHAVQQPGFAAIAAVFLVVGLAALAAFMVSFSNTQQLTSAQDVQGSRAYWAARGGLEWGVTNVFNASSCAATTTLTIDNFTVTVTCTAATYATDTGKNVGVPPTIYQLNATAIPVGATPGSVGYIERSVSTSVEI